MKKFSFFVLLCIVTAPVFSQSFMHGVGTGIFVEKSKGYDPIATAILTYSPRVNITESDFMSLSVGVPLTVGLSGNYQSSSYYGEESGSFNFMANIPLMVNVNLGAGSSKECEDRFGFFLGAGFGYHFGTQTYIDDYYEENVSKSGSTYGPAGNIGFRFAVGSHQKNIEARLSYMKGLKDTYKTDVYGLAALFNF
jgi:hypothetical protein